MAPRWSHTICGNGFEKLARRQPTSNRFSVGGTHAADFSGDLSYCKSFNPKMRNEFLNREIFYSMNVLCVLAERWRKHYNTFRRSPRWTTNRLRQKHG